MNENIYEIIGNKCNMLIKHKNKYYSTLIDISDIDKVKKHHWRLSQKRNKLYVCTSQCKNGNRIIYLSNYLLSYIPDGINEVDHIDGDSLNNTKSNLRIISRIMNIRNVKPRINNTVGIRGVSYNKKYNTYKVDFIFDKKRMYFKEFTSMNAAVYIRYLAEVLLMRDIRNTSNDTRIFECINALSYEERDDLEDYFVSHVNNKYIERYGIDVVTPVKNWNQTRREIDYPNRKFYEKLEVNNSDEHSENAD